MAATPGTRLTDAPGGATASRRAAGAVSLPMSLAAHAGGRVLAAVLTLLLAPVYARLLGLESYGLVGVFAALQGLFALFDMGLGTALNRELSLADTEGAANRASIVRTFETVYVAIGVLVGAATAVAAPWLQASWVSSQTLAPATVTSALLLMALAFVLQWPSSLYFGGLLGLQQHVLANAIQVGGTLLRVVGAAAVLLAWPSILAFFAWNAAAAALQTLALRAALTQRVGGDEPARLDLGIVSRSWRLAAGLTGIAVTSALLTQIDKVLLSGLLPLDAFGRYALATTAANGLYNLAAPVFAVAFPALTRRFAEGRERDAAEFYHLASQLMVVAVIPAAVVLVVFSHEVLLAWTGDPAMAGAMSTTVALLAAGTALNGLMMVPYALQVAAGWTVLALSSNVVAILLLPPVIYAATHAYGTSGAAACWLALNAGYLLIQPAVLHRRFFRGDLPRWYTADIGAPLLAVGAAAAVLRWGLPGLPSRLAAVTALAGIGVVLLLVGLAAAPDVRRRLWRYLRYREPMLM